MCHTITTFKKSIIDITIQKYNKQTQVTNCLSIHFLTTKNHEFIHIYIYI